jgi:hypothetical protein
MNLQKGIPPASTPPTLISDYYYYYYARLLLLLVLYRAVSTTMQRMNNKIKNRRLGMMKEACPFTVTEPPALE